MAEDKDSEFSVGKEIKALQSEIHKLSNHVYKLMYVMESHQSSNEKTYKDIDSMGEKLRTLESRAAHLNGGLNAVRYIIGAVSGTLLAMCCWFGITIIQNSQDIVVLKKETFFINQQIEKIGSK